jgi:VanZ family protein
MAAAVLVLIALLLGTHLPPRMVPSSVFRLAPDKVWHAVGYGTLAFFFYGGIRLRFQRWYTAFLLVVTCVAALSTLDEITQPLTGRDAEVLDFLASTAGAVIGATAAFVAEKLLRRWMNRQKSVANAELKR